VLLQASSGHRQIAGIDLTADEVPVLLPCGQADRPSMDERVQDYAAGAAADGDAAAGDGGRERIERRTPTLLLDRPQITGTPGPWLNATAAVVAGGGGAAAAVTAA
jgi:hypothetical protein